MAHPASDPRTRRRRPPLVLWYDEPATDWESESLPIGNGALGANVFGDPDVERLALAEKTLWSGGPGSAAGYDAGNWRTPRPDALDRIRARIAAEGSVTPTEAAAVLGQPKVGYGAYQPFGDVVITAGNTGAENTDAGAAAGPAGYRRALDIADAIASVHHDADGAHHSREYLASAPHGVIAARLTTDRPGAVHLTIAIAPAADRTWTTRAAAGRITCAGALDDNGMRFEAQLAVHAVGGTVTDLADGSVRVTGADRVDVFLAAGTDYAPVHPTYRGPDPHDAVTARVDAAVAAGYDAVRAAHVADHRGLFDRVDLDLAQRAPELPTDELLAAYAAGGLAPEARRALEVLAFQYGRYLLIASSRPGSLPANLQGVWNASTTPPWSADYHVNINLQMNYWPAQVTNLAETAGPLFDFVDGLVEPGRITAAEMFDAPGWVVHNETNPFGFTGVHDWPTSFWMPEAAAWLTRAFWEHYRFSLDETFLAERVYPLLVAQTRFWAHVLVADPTDGTLVANPTYSPEHGDFTAGASMTQQIIADLFANTVEAAGVLGDHDTARATAELLGRLDPGVRVGSWGQLQEWKADLDDPGNTHRHVSHLYAVYPGHAITPDDPAAMAAARASLQARGDGGTGWSKAWKISLWARLGAGTRAAKLLAEVLTHSTLANLWGSHPPFQIDGNFGVTAGIAEMLMQSHAGVVHLLPALPETWPEGWVRGLRARGAVVVDVTWGDGRLVEAHLATEQPGTLRVRVGTRADVAVAVTDAETGRTVDHGCDDGVVTFGTVAHGRYVIR